MCRPWVEQDEGPYHRDDSPVRADIVEGRPGVSLRLQLRVVDEKSKPIPGAELDVWQCDALGRYSGFPFPGAPTAARPTVEEGFLRGRQVTDELGRCELHTIYPGWYPGRTVHIHVMAVVGNRCMVSQLFFPDEVTDAIHARGPYAQRPGRDTRNPADDIYANHGDATQLTVTPDSDGYQAAICLIIEAPA